MLTVQEADLPSTFRAADEVSKRAQLAAVRWRRTQLLLFVVAAAAGIGSSAVPTGFDIPAAVAAAALAGALACELFRASSVPERAWYRGRAGAESIKTLAWKYAVGGRPFQVGTKRADEFFVAAVAQITEALSDVDWTYGTGDQPQQITAKLRAVRGMPLEDRKAIYREHRIADQRRWYGSKARAARSRSRLWSTLITFATSLGLFAIVAKVFGLVEMDLVGLATSAAAAAAAWTQFRQYDALSSAYSVAARELLLIEERLSTCGDEATWARFVAQSEEAVSREHTLWAAKRDVDARLTG